MTITSEPTTVERLAQWVLDAHQRSVDLVDDLTSDEILGPRMEIVNPLLWEIGHVAWFYEKWILKHLLGCKPISDGSDELYDSIAIEHDTRWDLPLPQYDKTLTYARQVRDRVLEALSQNNPSQPLSYFVQYSVFHEDMHTEAYTYTRQIHGYRLPRFSSETITDDEASADDETFLPPWGDVEIPGGAYMLGANRDAPFVFDNEKWAHPVELRAFAISRTAVTQKEFLAFVEDRGYLRRDLWNESGWRWREETAAEQPVYWRRESSGNWSRRNFDHWLPLEDHLPVLHVNWHEAQAYCRWANRRLPTEAEWELAAQRKGGDGDESPDRRLANLDWQAGGALPVTALAQSDSDYGCRQMIGNVWEWTASTFEPYPGFTPDPYKEYSQPWFGSRKVLRGGCWCTRSRLIRNTYRNNYTPDRRDVWAGFRTCAADD